MEGLAALIGAIGIAILIIILGIFQIVTGNPRLLHSYHYATTPADQLPALARETGAGLIAVGASCIVLTVPAVIPGMSSGSVGIALAILGATLMIGGILFMLVSIVRRNGGLITFSETGPAGIFGSMGPRKRVVACAVVGGALALIAIVPGAHMLATGDVSALHSYHYEGIPSENLPKLALAEGSGMIALGMAVFTAMVGGAGLSGQRSMKRWAIVLEIAGGVLFALGILTMIAAIPIFGGSLAG